MPAWIRLKRFSGLVAVTATTTTTLADTTFLVMPSRAHSRTRKPNSALQLRPHRHIRLSGGMSCVVKKATTAVLYRKHLRLLSPKAQAAATTTLSLLGYCMPERPCFCDSCHLCARYWHSPRHRKAWGGPDDPGLTPSTVPHLDKEAETTPRPPTKRLQPRPAAKPKAPPRRPLPCIHFGPLVDVPGCRPCKAYHVCEIGEYEGKCRGGIECQTCERYEADE